MMSASEYIVVGVKGGNATFNVDIDSEASSALTRQEAYFFADKTASFISNRVLATLRDRTRPKTAAELATVIEKKILEIIPELREKVVDGPYSKNPVQLSLPNFISMNSKTGKRRHTTEKPTDLLAYLVSLFSNEGDLVLDPFSGSGSTGEAALQLGRNVILVEQDPEYYEVSSERLGELSLTRPATLDIEG